MQSKDIETKRTLIAWDVGTRVEGQGKEQEGGFTQDTMRLGDGEDFHYLYSGDSFLCLYFCLYSAPGSTVDVLFFSLRSNEVLFSTFLRTGKSRSKFRCLPRPETRMALRRGKT